MKKQHIFAALAALAFTVTNTAHAEGIVGGQWGKTATTIEYKNNTTTTDKKSGGAFGAFIQFRGETPSPFGVHFSWSSNSAEYDAENASGRTGKIEADRTLDVLGMLTLGDRIDGQINGLAMLGFSVLDVEAPAFGISDTATGVKVVGGIEFPFADTWVVQALYEYANFGELDTFVRNIEFSQTVFRLNIGARF